MQWTSLWCRLINDASSRTLPWSLSVAIEHSNFYPTSLGLFTFLFVQIGGISVFNAHLGLIYGMCSGSYWSTFAAPTAPAVGTSPSTCFDDQVAVVDKQLTDLQQQIDADISAISEDAQNCIDDSVAGYSRQIAASSSQFTKCIGA